MSEGRRKVLEMLEAGTITQEDAQRLLEALGDEQGEVEPQEPAALQVTEPEEAPQAAEPEGNAAPTPQTVVEQAKEVVKDAKDALQQAKATVPKLTLHPEEGEDDLADAISKTVENTIEQVQKELGNDWGAIGEKINDAVTDKMNAFFGGMPTPPTPPTPPAPPAEQEGNFSTAEQSAAVYCDGLEQLEISWVAGPVEIKTWPESFVQLTEYPSRPLKPEEKLCFRYDDGELKIRWCQSPLPKRGFFFNPLSKRLVVELPEAWKDLEELKISTASGDICVADLPMQLEDMDLHTASGKVSLCGLHGETMNVGTASGRIEVTGVQSESLELGSASGKARLENVQGEEVNAHTASGSIFAANVTAETLNLSSASGSIEAAGFSAEDEARLHTVSGTLNACGDSPAVKADTVSGALTLALMEMPDEVTLSSISGKIELSLPADPQGGFEVQYNSTSGTFHSDFPLCGKLERKKGKASFGDGETEIKFSTTSGNMLLKRGN